MGGNKMDFLQKDTCQVERFELKTLSFSLHIVYTLLRYIRCDDLDEIVIYFEKEYLQRPVASYI